MARLLPSMLSLLIMTACAAATATPAPVPVAVPTVAATARPTVTPLPTREGAAAIFATPEPLPNTRATDVAPPVAPSARPTVTPLPTLAAPASATPAPVIAVPATEAPAPASLPRATPLPTAIVPTRTPTPAPTLPAPRAPPAPNPNPGARRMVALVFGQSNAGNWGDARATASPRVFNLRYRVLTRAQDPLRGAEGDGGSVWTRLGDLILAQGWYDEVVFVPVSFGATEIAKWTPDQPLFKQIDDAIDDVRARGWQFTHLLWHQGESDNALKTKYADYQLRMRSIVRGLRERGVGAPVFVSQATLCAAYPANNDIRGAQANVVNHDAGIWAGPDTDALGADLRHDGCHLSARGQAAAAQLWLAKLALYESRR